MFKMLAIFKKLTRDMEYKKPSWTSQHETYMWDENILDEINGRSDITDEKTHELADVVIEKNHLKKPVSCERTSTCLIYM